MDFDDYYSQNLPQVSPIVPTTQVRDLTASQTQRLLDRLLQELDDENTDLETLEKMFADLSLKTGIDYRVWSKQNLPLTLEMENSTAQSNDDSSGSYVQTADNDLLRQLDSRDKENNIHNDSDDYNSERALLLSLLHREKKLSRHYESLISSYETLMAYTAMSVRERREQNYGIYTTEDLQNQSPDRKSQVDNGIGIEGRTSIRSIQSIQIARSLKSRAEALKKNADILQLLARQKRQDTQLVKNLITSEAEQLAAELNKKDSSS